MFHKNEIEEFHELTEVFINKIREIGELPEPAHLYKSDTEMIVMVHIHHEDFTLKIKFTEDYIKWRATNAGRVTSNGITTYDETGPYYRILGEGYIDYEYTDFQEFEEFIKPYVPTDIDKRYANMQERSTRLLEALVK
jgi:hypothetical protein